MQYKTVPEWVREARIEHFESNLSVLDPLQAINHCIDRFAEWEDIYDELRTDIIPNKLNYEEVIGALLLGRNAIQEQQDNDERAGYMHVGAFEVRMKEYLARQERERQYDG